MKTLNFILDGFGFKDWIDFKASAFGFITLKTINTASFFTGLVTFVDSAFGFNHKFLIAYVVLIVGEWLTGVLASYKKGEKHESRKLGRMMLKIAVYSLMIYIPNTFQKESHFPEVLGYELDPFMWLYWIVIFVIIWQLIISVLENLKNLQFKFAGILLKVINKKAYEKLGIDEDSNTK
jgi:hypothetical protein